MSKYWRLLKQKMGNYNIENRAYKQLDKMEKEGVAAPKYKSFEEANQIDPEITKLTTTKLADLDDHLKRVSVTSSDPSPEKQWEMITSREMEHRFYPLQARQSIFGFADPDPEKVPSGRISFREALELMSFHQQITSMTRQVNNPKTSDTVKENLLTNLEPLHIKNENHPARKRVPVKKEKISKMLDYFAPFIYEIDTRATWGVKKEERKRLFDPQPDLTKDEDDEQDFNIKELTYLRKMNEEIDEKEKQIKLEREQMRTYFIDPGKDTPAKPRLKDSGEEKK